MHEIDGSIRKYYDKGKEVDRLTGGLRTGPLDVLDVGGGPGAYAAWLTERGHRVHVVDPIPLHVEQARAAHAGVTAEIGDARELQQEAARSMLSSFLGRSTT